MLEIFVFPVTLSSVIAAAVTVARSKMICKITPEK